jgi:CBS domain containing-hemolysin-like protein
MSALVAIALLTVLVSSLCSLFEATLYSTRMGALEAASADRRHRGLAERFIRMKSNIAEPTSAILILNTVANTAGATVCGMYAVQVLGPRWVPAFSIILTVAILFVGEILPKTYGALHWRHLWHLTVYPLALLQKVLAPLVWVTQGFAELFAGTKSTPVVTEGEIQATIRLGRRAGEISPAELTLLSSIFRFDETLTRQVMVPRSQVVFFDSQWSLSQCFALARKTKHTRYPLCIHSLDQTIGLVHMKDLLGIPPDQQLDLRTVARPLRHVPDTLSISRLLREMQSSRQHMAIVDDEYGTPVGIITMENILEQIVGAVQDEFDAETPEIVPEEPNVFRVQGHLPVDRVNRDLGLELYSDQADSLSGLLVLQMNRLLKAGDQVRLRGATAEVLETQGGRATLVRIRLTGDESSDTREADPTHPV